LYNTARDGDELSITIDDLRITNIKRGVLSANVYLASKNTLGIVQSSSDVIIDLDRNLKLAKNRFIDVNELNNQSVNTRNIKLTVSTSVQVPLTTIPIVKLMIDNISSSPILIIFSVTATDTYTGIIPSSLPVGKSVFTIIRENVNRRYIIKE
jgi:hypothetical protein